MRKKIFTAIGGMFLVVSLAACTSPPVEQVNYSGVAESDTLVVYRVKDPETGERIRCVASRYAGSVVVPSCDWKGSLVE